MNRGLHHGRAFRLAVCLALVAALSGCTQFNLGLTVNGDDTVTGQLLVTAEKAKLAPPGSGPVIGPAIPDWRVIRPQLPNLPVITPTGPAIRATRPAGQVLNPPQRTDIPAAFDELRGKLPALPAGDETAYETAQVYGVHISYRKKPLAEFNRDGVNLRREGNLYRFTLSLDPKNYGEKAAQYNPQTQQEFLRSLSLEISMTFPGRVLDSNGTVNDRTVSWKLAADQTKPAELRAVAEAPAQPAPTGTTAAASGGSFPWLLVVGGVVVLLLLAVVVVLLLRRPRGPVAAAPAAPTPAPVPPADHPGPV